MLSLFHSPYRHRQTQATWSTEIAKIATCSLVFTISCVYWCVISGISGEKSASGEPLADELLKYGRYSWETLFVERMNVSGVSSETGFLKGARPDDT